jgi:sulfoxide reductase catalytic subunit YedY
MHLIKDRGFAPGHGDSVTPASVYAQRRKFLMQAAAATLAASLASRQAIAQSSTSPRKLRPLPGARSAVSGALTME